MPGFFIVDGRIPVGLGVRRSDVPLVLLPSSWDAVGYCMTWDTDPPHPLDHQMAMRSGHRVEASEFWGKIEKARDTHLASQPRLVGCFCQPES
jgi:hypothetical protein